MAVIGPRRIQLLQPVEHFLSGGNVALPPLVTLAPAAPANEPWIRVLRAVEEIISSDPHDHRRMIAIMAHPNGSPLHGSLAALLPGNLAPRIHKIAVCVQYILRHEVSVAVGLLEIS